MPLQDFEKQTKRTNKNKPSQTTTKTHTRTKNIQNLFDDLAGYCLGIRHCLCSAIAMFGRVSCGIFTKAPTDVVAFLAEKVSHLVLALFFGFALLLFWFGWFFCAADVGAYHC